MEIKVEKLKNLSRKELRVALTAIAEQNDLTIGDLTVGDKTALVYFNLDGNGFPVEEKHNKKVSASKDLPGFSSRITPANIG